MDGCVNSLKMFKLNYCIIKAIAYNALPICDLVLMIMLKKQKKCNRVKLRQVLCILEI